MTDIREYRTEFYSYLSSVANWDNPHCDMLRKMRVTGGYKLTRHVRQLAKILDSSSL